ncbi:TerD family protein [Chryseobacterium arthrosphaerae]|uniref:Chemical-damaging agent resistance protein C n=1 Tax=Chryseobacterium arthrosphaerae TaxID=651561 RepID=A0A1B8ZU29_9FLAO|nr:TerD family protein [Chryseobacterium arthrosphaerae]AYZ13518.1 TerD family protein [Chryseobacterium arthrosphaerae]MDG4653520.1 TerD family protein [Chryseobacterium arthrosphaerae]OCA75087.1 chemical-damaging agent resistance protein C [Chryseobacterium arthrosphaerae]QUY54343.1 TerD family protein [Chryseobacterium arthrosphaerae]UEQ78817.1 TerD family protein [Chryseobacterium arthrosphaerae]
MAINLQKGQKIEIGLTKMTIGLGWDPNEGTGYDFDLDASAIMIDSDRKLVSEEYFVFYNNLQSPDGALTHTGDDPSGKNSDGDDDEAIIIDLDKVDSRVEEILFVVTIEDFERRKQNFGQVRNSYIRVVDNNTNQEIAKYELDEDFSIETGVEFGRLYKRNGSWKFEASGIGYRADLGFFLEKYYKGQIIK